MRVADFGGQCLIGECMLDAELLSPEASYLGLQKSGSYLYGTWRDPDGNLMRAIRGISDGSSALRFVFASCPGGQLEREVAADEALWSGAVRFERTGEAASFRSDRATGEPGFEYRHDGEGCAWADGRTIDVVGRSLGPAFQWFNTWDGGACLAVSAKYRSSGTLLDRPVEGFVGHEIHFFSLGANWINSPYGQGREICWQQVANEYDDGSVVQASFACGADGWGFAMVHDESGAFLGSTDVRVEAAVRESGCPEWVRYHFLDQSWTWRIDPQGERPTLLPGFPLIGADGTCRRDGDDRAVRLSMGNSDWWTDGRAQPILRR